MNRKLVLKEQNVLEEQREGIPEPPPGGAIVRICYAGFCHSDLHALNGEQPAPRLPIVLGHEISGVVHSLGEEYAKENDGLKVGDKVVAFPWGGCLQCDVCNAGVNKLCGHKDGPHCEMYGAWNDGGFQHYLKVVNPWRLAKLRDDADMALSCLIPCSGVTAYNAVELCGQVIEREIKVKGNANVIFNGAGALSLWATEIIKAQYREKVNLLVTDIAKEKLEDAGSRGADATLCLPKEGDLQEILTMIKNALSGKNADAIVDFVNIPSTQMRLFNSLARGGTLVFVGLFGKEMAPLNVIQMTVRQISLQGCLVGTKEHLSTVLDLVSADKVKGPPITLIKFDEIERTLKHMLSGAPYRGRYVAEISKV